MNKKEYCHDEKHNMQDVKTKLCNTCWKPFAPKRILINDLYAVLENILVFVLILLTIVLLPLIGGIYLLYKIFDRYFHFQNKL